VIATVSLTVTSLPLSPARADASLPANQVWIDVDVRRCSAVTFEASGFARFLPGGRHRTAVIVGTVVSSGFDGPAATPQDEARRAAALPSPKSSVSYALREWEETSCDQIGAGTRRFRFTYDCDAGPPSAQCLSPYPLVRPAAEARR
jgi:hypothetical protein